VWSALHVCCVHKVDNTPIYAHIHTHSGSITHSLIHICEKYTCTLSLYLSASAYVLDELVVGEHKEFVEGVAYAIVGSLKAPVPNRQISRKMDTQ
jgi:hypothetical protein